ncbi:MAG: ribonuclease P protein component [Patescibacteria group bacterium]|nr:ribonuclease P protein component [Patescibacteria group bacterium]
MLKKINRLKLKKDIESLMKHGKAVYFLFLVLRFQKNGLNYSRFVIITSNKVSKRANKRNLIRRRIREILRHNLGQIASGYDIAVITSPKIIYEKGRVADFKEIERVLGEALRKARLI